MSLVKKFLYWKMFGKHRADRLYKEQMENEVIKSAKEKRQESEKRIDNMIAQINGCGDRWFLKPMETIDECVQKDINGR